MSFKCHFCVSILNVGLVLGKDKYAKFIQPKLPLTPHRWPGKDKEHILFMLANDAAGLQMST
jgi:hypothetical protein